MKNHLKHRPYLRFVDAPAAETGGDVPAAQDAPAAAAEETAQQVDWEAEARKWKELSRKNESRMKENAEKARLYDEAQEQGKSELQKAQEAAAKAELQKAQEAAAKAEARAAAMEAEAMRAKVAAATGVDADLLSGSSEEELRASAERLLAWRGAQVPKGAPATDAGVRGDEIRAARQLTREDLKKMSPAEIIKARQDGQLNNIMGIA